MTSENRPPLQGHITRSQGGHLFGKAIPYAVKLAALLGNTFYAHQVEQQAQQEAEQDRQYRQQQHSVNDLYPLQGTPMNPVQRYAPTQPQPLTPPPSQLGLNSIHHMEEARRRAQELSQYQQAPDFQVNPASQKRMFDPVGFVPPQIAENHAEGFDPLAARKVRIAEQGQKAQQDYDASLKRRKNLTHPNFSEQNWAEIKKEFNQMPIKTYKHLQEKDRVREVLTAMKNNQPIDWTVDPDTSELLHNWYEKYKLQSVAPSNRPTDKTLDQTQPKELTQEQVIQEVTKILGYKPLMNKDPYIIIGEQAYGLKEAIQKAKEHVAYLKKYGKPLPPLPYPTTPPHQVPQAKWRSVYPDVTLTVNKELLKIKEEINGIKNKHLQLYLLERKNLLYHFRNSQTELIKYIFNNFENNKNHDLQVNHRLPGQVVMRDKITKQPFLDKSHAGYILTEDQYAVFRNHVVTAGFISNFTFGYAIAVTGNKPFVLDAASLYGQLKEALNYYNIKLSDKDLEACYQGYLAYYIDLQE